MEQPLVGTLGLVVAVLRLLWLLWLLWLLRLLRLLRLLGCVPLFSDGGVAVGLTFSFTNPSAFCLQIIPNAEHSEATGVLELLPATATFLRGVQRGIDATARPVFNWTTDETTGTITVTQISDHTPLQVNMWSAKTATNHRRDFRVINGNNATECKAEGGLFIKSKNMCGNLKSFWKKKTLTRNKDGTWTASMDVDPSGKWTAFFVHMEYEGPQHTATAAVEGRRRLDWPISSDGRYQSTTTVSIIPRTFPFPDCHGDDCLGTLV